MLSQVGIPNRHTTDVPQTQILYRRRIIIPITLPRYTNSPNIPVQVLSRLTRLANLHHHLLLSHIINHTLRINLATHRSMNGQPIEVVTVLMLSRITREVAVVGAIEEAGTL